ncbi:MAG: EAL domain-containing protein [Pseudomonadota bacterium]
MSSSPYLQHPAGRKKIRVKLELLRFLAVILAYVAAGRLGLAIPYLSPNVSLIWLPTGVAVAALMRWGKRSAPAIYLAAFLLEISAGYSLAAAVWLGIGNTLAPYLTCAILRRQHFDRFFSRRKDVVWFSMAAMAGMTLSASGGALTLWRFGLTNNIGQVWLSWWAGDTVGVLLAAPLLLSLSYRTIAEFTQRREEVLIFALIFVAANWFIFLSPQAHFRLTFIAVTVLVWPAMRFGISAASVAVLASSAVAAWATATARGPFNGADAQANLLILWGYMTTLVIVTLIITALQTESKKAADELREAFERVSKVASRLPGLIMQYRVNPDGSASVPYASDAIRQMFETRPEEVRYNAFPLFDRIDQADIAKARPLVRDASRSLTSWQSEFRLRRLDGEVRWLYIDALPEPEPDGGMLWHCFITDITERKQAQHELQIAAYTFESQEGIFVTDANWVILRLNQALTRITGYDNADLLGKKPPIYRSKQQGQEFFDHIADILKKEKFWQGEMWSKRKNGEVYPQMITLTAITNAKGEVSNYISSFTDISRHKSYEEEIRNLAFYDPLTQLPNRRLLMDRLQHLISLSKRSESHSAILFIDLDNFKTLNDTRGHDAGDLLLVETAARLQTCVRDSDTVARLGGDEFVVVLEELSMLRDEAVQQADMIANKIRMLLSEPYHIMDFEHHGSSSIGVCLFQGGEVTVKDLFKRADTAMYEAKTSGRDAVRFFDPAMQAVLVVRMMLESNLRVALAQNQFKLYYQIQVNADGDLIGAEALLRWIHPDRGFIPPAEFIPLAEETGLIVPIGAWVLETACAQLKKWEANEDTRQLTLAVNVSARQFQQIDFADKLRGILECSAIDPTRLKIELTESTILDNVDSTTAKMHELRALGIAFSMDDFGTGYSSLAYLQRLPLNQLKIDRSFVRDLSDDENDATIVRAIISLGVNLGLNVIAEGVETEAQRSFLIEHNCSAFQGYLFSKPLPLEAFQEMLQASRVLKAKSA